MRKVQKINVASANSVLKFAAGELKKYLLLMSKDNPDTEIIIDSACLHNETSGYRIGLYTDFGLKMLNEEADYRLDDEIYINVRDGNGIISGANPRSVLMAVYRLLAEAGCRWVRPGKEGEFIPEADITQFAFNIHESPSHRHRGICIEGAVSLENVADMVDWLPKVGLNSYFIQFREAYTFFERWYTHANNPYKAHETFSIEKAREYVKQIEGEIKKRGLVYHAVGHGWTCEPLGIPGLSWEPVECDYPEEVTKYFAEVNGERKMTDGIPLNVNLCYSNPEVRKIIISGIVDYLRESKQVDFLHFWLADGMNSQCECSNCREERPSDFYVQMLNELDIALTENSINTRIVFLIYLDLLWAPEKNRIKNQDRFVMMYAPISRTYTYPFEAENVNENAAPYERNRINLPSSVSENLEFVRKWQALFKGDSFDFDYHFMWDHYCDPGYVKISEVLHKDIQNLKKNGLNGLISCQPQRAFFPTGLGMYTLARTLWNSALEFNEIAGDYFASAFGNDGIACFSYMKEISTRFTPPYLRGELELVNSDLSRRFSSIKEIWDGYEKLIEKNLKLASLCRRKSWQYLKHHKEICARLAEILANRTQNDLDAAMHLWEDLKKYVQKNEDELQQVLDVYELIFTFEAVKTDIVAPLL